MNIKLLTDHHLGFLSLKGGCTGSSESTNVKIPHCLKSHVVAHIQCIFRLTECIFFQRRTAHWPCGTVDHVQLHCIEDLT